MCHMSTLWSGDLFGCQYTSDLRASNILNANQSEAQTTLSNKFIQTKMSFHMFLLVVFVFQSVVFVLEEDKLGLRRVKLGVASLDLNIVFNIVFAF